MNAITFTGTVESVAIVRPAADESRAALDAAFAAFTDSGRKRLEAAIRIGAILADRKKACGHGNWLKWLEAHFPQGRKRAADFLRVYERRAECNRTETFEEALQLLANPPKPAPQPHPPTEDTSYSLVGDEVEESPEVTVVPDSPVPTTSDVTAPNVTGRLHLDPPAPVEGEVSPEVPASDAPPVSRTPSWFKPGNHSDPDHPFADLLAKMTALSAAFTRAMADPDHGAKLRDYLLAVQAQKPSCPLFVLNRMLFVDGKHYGAQFIGLRGVRRIVRLAGMGEKKKPQTLLKEFTEAQEGEE